MLNKYIITAFMTFFLASSANALTCQNDYSGDDGCANNAQAAGDCETLGYSKDNVNECEHYLYCPFDTAYKKCVSIDCSAYNLTTCSTGAACAECKAGGRSFYKVTDCKAGYEESGDGCKAAACTGYKLASCPTGATSCSTCLSGTTTKYKVNGCKKGYILSSAVIVGRAQTCIADPCTGYTLTSCPTGATSCNECLSGTTTKYKINGCKAGYEEDGNTCKVATCSGYNLSKCPDKSYCDECVSGTTTKYKFVHCVSASDMPLTTGDGCTKYCRGILNLNPKDRNAASDGYETCKNANGTYSYLVKCKKGWKVTEDPLGLMRYCSYVGTGGGEEFQPKPGEGGTIITTPDTGFNNNPGYGF